MAIGCHWPAVQEVFVEENQPAAAACLQNSSPRLGRWWTGGRHSRPLHSTDSTGSSTSSSKSLSVSFSLNDSVASVTATTNGVAASSNGGGSSDGDALTRIAAHRGESLHVLCETMKRQIISRAFYGWLAHCRHLSTVRTHLSGLVNQTIVASKVPYDASQGVDNESWNRLVVDGVLTDASELHRLVFYGGVAPHLRKQVWPYLLGHYPFGSTADEREAQDSAVQAAYEATMSEWLAVEAIIRQRDKEMTAARIAKLSSGSQSGEHTLEMSLRDRGRSLSNEVFDGVSSDDECNSDGSDQEEQEEQEEKEKEEEEDKPTQTQEAVTSVQVVTTHPSSGSENIDADGNEGELNQGDLSNGMNEITESTSIPQLHLAAEDTEDGPPHSFEDLEKDVHNLGVDDGHDICSMGSRSSCISPVSSQGGVYTMELLETYGLNLHRIDKDVQRCDRNYHFFTPANLDKLRNVMCTYVWCHLDTGYMQGMCDLVAPLLVIIDDEALTYSCFCELMKRMAANFPQGGAMDNHFANMRSLIQILDAEIFDLMQQNGDYTHLYFCYRWFLLDFKRELVYDDVFTVWETIWAARSVASSHFVLFVGLALVQYYREIILANAMDFTDIIKFFNEMAERHDAKAMLRIARELVHQLQTLIENK